MKNKKNLLFVFIFLILIFGGDKFGYFNSIRSFIYTSKNNFYANFKVLTFWRSGEKRIKQLENLYLSCLTNEAKDAELKNENQVLKKQLGIEIPRDKKIVLTKVIDAYGGVMRLQIPQQEINIPIGTKVISEKILVGKVQKVDHDYITVLLPTNNEFTEIGESLNNSVKGLIKGGFLTEVYLEKVLIDQKLDISDKVINQPEGFLVGEIISVEKKDQELFQKAKLKPFINYYQLSEVFLVL